MAGMTRYAQKERSGLCDTFLEVGPDAPTMCDGWQTKDLAAHLVVRERRPDAALGMFVPPLAGHLSTVQDDIAGSDWTTLVDRVRSGPPRWTPMGAIPAIDERMNLAEFFIHHEDVLRAQPDATRRTLEPAESAAIWAALPMLAKMTLRDCRVGIVADCEGHGRRTLREPKDQHGSVVVSGAPGEVLLFCYGRQAVADVQLDGADGDLSLIAGTSLGF